MKISKIYYVLQVLIVVLFQTSFNEVFAQEERKKPSRQAAMEAFSKGDYENAYSEFQMLLDNFSNDMLREAVRRRDAVGLRGKLAFEASGGVNLQTIEGIAATGVERISVGALTHSAVNLDIGLDA